MRALALCLATVLVAASAASLLAAGAMPPRDLLRTLAGFTDTEWAVVERGEAVSKLVDTDSREVAVVGAVRITGRRDQLVARSRDLQTLKGSLVLDVGQFSAVPDPSDLRPVTLDERSLDLRACQSGDCPVRLSAADVGRFQREVNWSAPDWRNQSMAVWRSVLANYARAYLAGGRSALPDYVNRRDPLSVASEVAQLAGDYEFVADYSPAFHTYLKEFGPRIPAGAEQMLYWTREDFGIRPIVRISHQVIYSTTPPATPVTIIAINQVYADHYLDASLTVTLALDAGRDFYMISVSRARTRSLSGFLRRFARSAVQGRSRDAMRSALTSTKVAIEKKPS
ncbi:MAG TPA: hypothetical protein VFT47_16765 [Vicinamibacterales bacterium]|nr:hypothetical protein [Vicinamibacterales bacterium]